MDEASFGTITGINADGTANFGDRNPYVTFFRGTRVNQHKSQLAGVPVYDPVDIIKIVKPGERDEIHRQATEYDKMRYREQWRAYCDNIELAASGTPLSALLPSNPELVDNLRALKVVTVQQLAELPDSAVGAMQFGHDLRKKAQRYLAVAEKGVEYHKLEREREDKDFQINDLRTQVADLQAKLSTLLQNAGKPDSQPQPQPVGGFAPLGAQPTNSPVPPPLISEYDEPEEVPQPTAARRGRR